jgi:4'-phosphopantetheinyl transferase
MSHPGAGEHAVTLWWTPVRAVVLHLDRLRPLLDRAELRQAERFRVEDARRRYLAAHLMARLVLGPAVGDDPGRLRFAYGEHGKPRLDHPEAPHFNLSHSGDTAVVAVAVAELGVDVETLRPVPRADRLALRYFSERERSWLAGRPTTTRDADFLALWTCKEAYLKAVGIGIGMPLKEVETGLQPPRLEAIPGDDAAGWTLLHTELPEPATCSVALRGSGWRLVTRHFDWGSL